MTDTLILAAVVGGLSGAVVVLVIYALHSITQERRPRRTRWR